MVEEVQLLTSLAVFLRADYITTQQVILHGDLQIKEYHL